MPDGARLVWFRSDLRVHDNPALLAACRGRDRVVAVYHACPAQWRRHDWGAAKVGFVQRSLRALAEGLDRLHIPLVVDTTCADFAAIPARLAERVRALRVTEVHANREYEVNEAARDAACAAALEAAGAALCLHDDQCIVPPGALRTGAGGWYRVFTPFRRAWTRRLAEEGVPAAAAAPAPRPADTGPVDVPSMAAWSAVVGRCAAALPGADRADLWPGGEAAARARLASFTKDRVCAYDTARDRPAIDGTSALSPYLAVGAISVRRCLAAALAANAGRLEGGNAGVITWIGELAWRDFYRHILHAFPRVGRNRAFQPETERVAWRDDPEAFAAWCAGRTGIPIIDAGMRQLGATGWMHNRLRMVTAMFLTKNLLIDWRAGERFFMQHLVDGDFASNNGGWQWSASTGTDAVPYFRVFNPVSQGEKFDPGGAFVRRWIAELAEVPDRFIHAPWRGGTALPTRGAADRSAYPVEPIVDLRASRARAIEAFRTIRTG